MAQETEKGIGEMVDISSYILNGTQFLYDLNKQKIIVDDLRKEGHDAIIIEDRDMYKVYRKRRVFPPKLGKRVYAEGGKLTGRDLTLDQVREAFEYIDKHGEHKFVSEYKKKNYSDDTIGGLIGAWATNNTPEEYKETLNRIYKMENKKRDMYLDYVNNFLTVEKFAEHYNISEEEANNIIDEGRIEHENYVAKNKGRSMAKTGRMLMTEEEKRSLTYFDDNLVKYDKEDFVAIVDSKFGWAVSGQAKSILDGEPYEDQNTNALSYIRDLAYKKGEEELGDSIDRYLNKIGYVRPKYNKGGSMGNNDKIFNSKNYWNDSGVKGRQNIIDNTNSQKYGLDANKEYDEQSAEAKRRIDSEFERMESSDPAGGSGLESHYAKGGITNQYKGMKAEQVWNDWTEDQRSHFISDHLNVLAYKGNAHDLVNREFSALPLQIRVAIEYHVFEGQYAKGGKMEWTTNQQKMQDKIDKLNKALSSPATSPMMGKDIKNKISELENKLQESIFAQAEAQMKENERIVSQKKAEQAEKDRLEKEEKRKNRFKGQFYIDISDDINRQTFRKKLWQSGLRYRGKESGATLRIILDNHKDINKVFSIYKGLLEKEKMDIPKLDSISGVFKRSGIAKSKLK